MPKRNNLRALLRNDILRKRVEAPKTSSQGIETSSPSQGQSSPQAPGSPAASVPSERGNSGVTEKDNDVDSLFVEAPEKEKTRDEILQIKLEELLAQGRPGNAAAQSSKTANLEIEAKTEELKALVMRATEAGPEERKKIQRRRESLVEQVRRLKVVEREKEMRETKEKLEAEAKTLPEPVSEFEKKLLKQDAQRATKALAGLERVPKKRQLEDSENDLDGEDRLRLGKSLKKQQLNPTGHWRNTIHDYVPEDDLFNRMSAEDKQRFRRELAEYAAQIAKAQRKSKNLGGGL